MPAGTQGPSLWRLWLGLSFPAVRCHSAAFYLLKDLTVFTGQHRLPYPSPPPIPAVSPCASPGRSLDAAPQSCGLLCALARPRSTQRIFLSVRLCRMATVFVWNCTSASHSHGLRISVSPLPSSVSVGFGSAQGTVPQLAPLTSPPMQHQPLVFPALTPSFSSSK